MPNQTAKMQFNTFLENDVVDWEKINENFEKLDNVVLCVESGEKTAAYSGASSGNAVWRYKKYSDDSVEMCTSIDFSTLRCSSGGKSPYYSDSVIVNYPFVFTKIDNVETHVLSSSPVILSDITSKTATDSMVFRLNSINIENANESRRIFIGVKGR